MMSLFYNTIMTKAMRLGFSFLLLLLSSSCLFAQSETTMYSMVGVPQSTNYNPAFMPKYKFILSFAAPSVYAHYSNSSFKYSDFAVKVATQLSLISIN